MKLVNVATAILAIALAISVASNVWQYGNSQQLGASLQETNQRLDALNQSLAQISQDLQEGFGLLVMPEAGCQHARVKGLKRWTFILHALSFYSGT